MSISSTNNLERAMLATLARRSFAAILLVAVSASLVHAQSDCLVNAGITPQEVCLADHISLGGNPTVPSALTTDVANIQWTVVTPRVDASFEPSATPLHPDPDWLEYTGHVTIID